LTTLGRTGKALGNLMAQPDQMRPARISVIIPVLDGAETLGRCLDALEREALPSERFEILVVDNGSRDGSVAIARAHSRVKLLEEPRPGAYAARNRGLAESRGEIVAFLDPDCEVQPGWLRRIEESFADPGTQLVCGSRLPIDDSPLLGSLMDYEVAKDARVIGGDDEAAIYGFTCNMAVRREVFERLGGFVDLKRGADTLFAREVAREFSCRSIRFDPGMAIVNLEMDGPLVYWKKVFLYGYHRRRNNRILPSRPLGNAERLEIYRGVVRDKRYSPARAALLLAGLAIGAVCWRAGYVAAALRRDDLAVSRPTSGPGASPAGRLPSA